MDYTKYTIPAESFPKYPAKPRRPDDSADARAYKEYALALEKYEAALKLFEKNRDDYNEGEAILLDLFWKDAFKELGISRDHPKAELLKNKAWDHGHASGFSDVYFWLGEFWELAK